MRRYHARAHESHEALDHFDAGKGRDGEPARRSAGRGAELTAVAGTMQGHQEIRHPRRIEHGQPHAVRQAVREDPIGRHRDDGKAVPDTQRSQAVTAGRHI